MRNFLYRFRQNAARFMQGRYGTDKLNMALLIGSLAFEFLYMIFRNAWTGFLIFNVLSLILILISIFRTFSKNIQKRYAENQKFERLLSRLKTLKTHHIFKCSSCGQKIRVPRLHGKRVEIRCPKCGQTFIRKV